jgi:hypothetical protein
MRRSDWTHEGVSERERERVDGRDGSINGSATTCFIAPLLLSSTSSLMETITKKELLKL